MFTATGDDDAVRLVPRRTPRSAWGLPLFAGLAAGLMIAGLCVAWWEGRPAGPVAAPAEVVATGAVRFADVLIALPILVGNLVASLALIVVPTVGPLVLSQRGYLSIGRWAALAGCCAFVMLFGLLLLVTAEGERWLGEPYRRTGGFFLVLGLLGAGGCLLAAALYPKSPTQSPP